MRLRGLVSFVVSALVLAAPIAAAVENLDGDAAKETVAPFDPPPASANGRTVILRDKCGTKTKTYSLSKVFDRVKYIRVRELDGNTERPEVLFELRSANGRTGLTKIMRLGRPNAAPCAKPRTLFVYSSKAPPIKPPSGVRVVNWRITFGNYDTTRAGNEMRLWEGYVLRTSSSGSPTLQRVTDYRYSSAGDNFFSYRSAVSPID